MLHPSPDQRALLPTHILVGGAWRDVASGGSFDHVNPASGLIQQSVPLAGAEEIIEAVDTARRCWPAWRSTPPVERQRILIRLAGLMRTHSDRLGTIATMETGRVFSEAGAMLGATYLENAAGWADKVAGEVFPADGGADFEYATLEPVGIVGAILTWNGPIPSIGMTVGPALAAGCCVILKPSELAPFSALYFGRLCEEAGLPSGVLSVLPGLGEAGQALIDHPDVAKISFTGGPATARKIAARCAGLLKPSVLELGGKSACLVFDDADLDRVVANALRITAATGQACTLATRILVHDSRYDELAARLRDAWSAIRVGDPFDPATQMGAVVNEAACVRILGIVERAEAGGDGTVLYGGRRIGGELADGAFVMPTLVGDINHRSELAQHEVFGPVVTMARFDEEDEAIAMANDTPYGLAAYVHSAQLSRCIRATRQLVAGNIGVNGGHAPGSPNAPFGGTKESGYGRLGGRAALLEFSQWKSVDVAL